MQTFLPYSSFKQSASVLDRARLGKQRVEALQILNTLQNGGGWQNHPAVRMWQGYSNALVIYGHAICGEWKSRGYKDTCYDKISRFWQPGDFCFPPWLGLESFHASHRSNLLRKDYAYYSQFGWTELDNLPYVWPV